MFIAHNRECSPFPLGKLEMGQELGVTDKGVGMYRALFFPKFSLLLISVCVFMHSIFCGDFQMMWIRLLLKLNRRRLTCVPFFHSKERRYFMCYSAWSFPYRHLQYLDNS